MRCVQLRPENPKAGYDEHVHDTVKAACDLKHSDPSLHIRRLPLCAQLDVTMQCTLGTCATLTLAFARLCTCACARACVCARTCAHACVRACGRACACMHVPRACRSWHLHLHLHARGRLRSISATRSGSRRKVLIICLCCPRWLLLHVHHHALQLDNSSVIHAC